MRILVAYRAIPQSPGWATGDALVEAFRGLGHEAQPYAKLYGKDDWLSVNDDVRSQDLLVYLECNDKDPQYIELQSLDCPRLYWEFDTAMHPDWSRQWIADPGWHWDHVFIANPDYLAPGRSYLPYGVNDKLFTAGNINGARKGAAIIGTPFKERVEFARAAKVEVLSNIFREDYVRELQHLAVSIHQHASGGDGLLVARIWESLGCGACLLAEDSPALHRHFVDGRHLVLFGTPEECHASAEQLLEDVDTRTKIAKAGHDLVMAKHTYAARARAILGVL